MVSGIALARDLAHLVTVQPRGSLFASLVSPFSWMKWKIEIAVSMNSPDLTTYILEEFLGGAQYCCSLPTSWGEIHKRARLAHGLVREMTDILLKIHKEKTIWCVELRIRWPEIEFLLCHNLLGECEQIAKTFSSKFPYYLSDNSNSMISWMPTVDAFYLLILEVRVRFLTLEGHCLERSK